MPLASIPLALEKQITRFSLASFLFLVSFSYLTVVAATNVLDSCLSLGQLSAARRLSWQRAAQSESTSVQREGNLEAISFAQLSMLLT